MQRKIPLHHQKEWLHWYLLMFKAQPTNGKLDPLPWQLPFPHTISLCVSYSLSTQVMKLKLKVMLLWYHIVFPSFILSTQQQQLTPYITSPLTTTNKIAFASPKNAIRWCFETQLALLKQDWPEEIYLGAASSIEEVDGVLIYRGLRGSSPFSHSPSLYFLLSLLLLLLLFPP